MFVAGSITPAFSLGRQILLLLEPVCFAFGSGLIEHACVCVCVSGKLAAA